MGERWKKAKPKSLPSARSDLEDEAHQLGFQQIAGIDEVGRGCLAGPVVAAAVLLPWREPFPGVIDSKQLTPKQREDLAQRILAKAFGCGFGIVSPKEIDRMNIARASVRAMRLAVEQLHPAPDFLLIDGRQAIPLLSIAQRPVTKGDCLSLSIAAASIVAKVKRDQIMQAYARQYPQFHFDRHKGYGTKEHWEALWRFGPTPIHRLSFRGVAKNPLQL